MSGERENNVLEVDRATNSVSIPITSRRAQDLLWAYAARCRAVDPVFSRELEAALYAAGFALPAVKSTALTALLETITFLPDGALGYASQAVPPYKVDIIPLAINGLQHAIAAVRAKEAAQEKKDE